MNFNYMPLSFHKRKATALLPFAILFVLVAVLPAGPGSVSAQEVADTIRVNTRVVFMDALVKDKRTGVPISDLKPENFEVFDDGNARQISYFTREGQARKPLALVLILDLRESGAGRYLKRPEVLKVVSDELAKLSPQDEVAILAMSMDGEDGKRLWLSGLTRDPAELVAALARAPLFIDSDDEDENETSKTAGQPSDANSNTSLTIGSEPAASAQKEVKPDFSGPGRGTPGSDEAVEVEVIKGKKGSVVT